MVDEQGNLYLYEAIELRNEYDRHISMLHGLLGEPSGRRGLFNDNEGKVFYYDQGIFTPWIIRS